MGVLAPGLYGDEIISYNTAIFQKYVLIWNSD